MADEEAAGILRERLDPSASTFSCFVLPPKAVLAIFGLYMGPNSPHHRIGMPLVSPSCALPQCRSLVPYL